jgi:hypothetical protein
LVILLNNKKITESSLCVAAFEEITVHRIRQLAVLAN